MSSLHIENRNTLFFHNFFSKKSNWTNLTMKIRQFVKTLRFHDFFILMNFSSLESA